MTPLPDARVALKKEKGDRQTGLGAMLHQRRVFPLLVQTLT